MTNGTVTMTRFAVRGTMKFDLRFAVPQNYNVAATAKRRRCAICRAAEVFTIKAASQEMRSRGDHITFLKTSHGY